ncbi:hypothetical protein BDY17DRAFT_296131 [Neohortaea acidophila]|uniref:Uncharacterized protein n=1 Tax=Neohortaea acidophila TaxID=245834 RepID=A0A6A6PY62_9PEZI|nr:uncharacterized protein BDY17DRAFT_296131 [Neohortaea acidophila]KAF2484684.1 hypothetical protein BDY17DRAFT_296131 [Neohortaea acidophila]
MPTRALKWKRKVATHGNTEIFSKGETVPNARGNVPAIDGTFSKALIKSSREYFDLVRQGVFKAPMSILEVMKTAAVARNPRRVWLNAPRHPYKEKITRIKLLPWKIRESGKLEFFRYHVQELEERFCGYRELSKEPTPQAGGADEQGEDETMDDGGAEADDEGVVADVMEEGEEEGEKLEAGSQGDDNKNDDDDGDGNASDHDGGGLFVSQRGVLQRGVSQGGEPLTPKSPSPEF